MNRHTRRVVALAGLTLPLSIPAQADSSIWSGDGLYLGGTLGVAHSGISQQRVADRFESLGYDFEVELEDRNRWAWGAIVGYQWTPHFATELGYLDMGALDARITGQPSEVRRYLDSGADALPQTLAGWELAAVGTYPLSKRYYVYGRVGVMASRSKASSAELAQEWARSTEGPSFGLGIGYRFNSQWRTRAGISYYDLDNQRTSLASVSLIYQFGEPSQRDRHVPSVATAPPPTEREPAPVATPPPTLHLAIIFDYNSVEVSGEFQPRLRVVANHLHQNPNKRVLLTGHSDSRGPSDYNRTLSKHRAKSVRDFMVETYNLNPDRFELRALGDTQPFADNATEEGRALNRRVILDWVEP
ncbi:OmpA family protein [Marinimicrobium sp. ABcell2]|uniref:OmpA family protein n=1 Tax=Marinimicrobium sp. ABcell2 TaxID=3069751 RepID=UPI0027B33AFC|nr:OmpA family protein [Marinimicrobium sp. ABcell2]MDQ2075970.1 OmpA family protein [Marinimicrobium sp. ABcell2]